MRSTSFFSITGGAILLGALASPVSGQAKPPKISARQFVSGSAKVTVSGSFSIDQDVQINTAASIGDGEMTWLQFGNSGSAAPNATITYGETGETGIVVASGKNQATGGIIVGEKSECSGTVQVTGTLVSGRYKCVGLTSYDQTTRKMAKVDVEVIFTARS
jgi:hypothetical protein